MKGRGMGQGQLGSVLRAFSATGMGQLFAPHGIPDRDSAPDGLWLLAASRRALSVEHFRRCFLIRVWHSYLHPQPQPGTCVGLGSAGRGGGHNQLAGAHQQEEAGWILALGCSRRAGFEGCGRVEWCCMMD